MILSDQHHLPRGYLVASLEADEVDAGGDGPPVLRQPVPCHYATTAAYCESVEQCRNGPSEYIMNCEIDRLVFSGLEHDHCLSR